MKRRTLLTLATSSAAALALTACGGGSSDEAAPAGGASSAAASEGGLITIIVNDPSNPYWAAEGDAASAAAEELGYEANVAAHRGDTNTESQLVDTAISSGSVALLLDPANADGSVAAIQRADAAGIPVFLINAEINQTGIAKAQLVSNNAQGAALGAQQWAQLVGQDGQYAELLGAPSDNNAATRSNGYQTVLSQYPGLQEVAEQVANWDRTEGRDAMQAMLQASPGINAVISGNDEMALGAIAALQESGQIGQMRAIGGFDGSPDAVDAIRAGTLSYTVLQPVVQFSQEAVQQADNFLKTGETGVAEEKQAFDCVLITPDNVDSYTAPFTLSS